MERLNCPFNLQLQSRLVRVALCFSIGFLRIKILFFCFKVWIFFLSESIGGGAGYGERGGPSGRTNPNVGGADGGGEAHSVQLPGRERGVSQVQEEGPEPREVSRQRSSGHPMRAHPAEGSSSEVHDGDGWLRWMHVLQYK